MGPPSHFFIPNSSVNRLGAAHIPLKLLRLLVALVIGPTSLNGGEGLLAGRCMWLEASWDGEGEGGLQSRGLGGIEKRDQLGN